ncbi:DNA repair protein SWI5 homolog isoform X2 [Dreissena polymorpha]|uniref:DNA repair protein SWI5 homolog isoform X2 n=1 Tax=Dreissena polymorpha TaxID=45954 RepID=UPI002263BF00|nr:DNA repair protein SWI5 homolog isoform X2 [Dreissena polymorpha]
MHKSNVSRKPSVPFKSPLQSSSRGKVVQDDPERRQALEKRLGELNKQIKEMQDQGYREGELQTHIEKLHEYNEIKDVGQLVLGRLGMLLGQLVLGRLGMLLGQLVLGRLANLQGVTTRDLYEQYGLDLED